nr:hypothetical protein [Moorena producens]
MLLDVIQFYNLILEKLLGDLNYSLTICNTLAKGVGSREYGIKNYHNSYTD